MKSEEIVNTVNVFRNYVAESLSENTAKVYSCAVTLFLVAFPNISRPSDISADDIILKQLN